MRDWNQILRQRLPLRGLSAAQESEIIAELAGHLEDLREQYRSQGSTEAQAVARALDELADSSRLARSIRRSKREEEIMNPRTKQLWLPGLVSMLIAIALPLLAWLLLRPLGRSFHILYKSYGGVQLDFVGLSASLLAGATAAFLSGRSHATRFIRLTSALFPAGVYFGLIAFILLVRILFANLYAGQPSPQPAAVAAVMLNWVVLPGIALSLGALPFLRRRNIQAA